MTPQVTLAQTLAARLCHDLAGLGGTLANLLELMDQDLDQAAEALPLAREAASGLLRRLRIVRAAWGGADDWPADGLASLAASVASRELHVGLDPATIARGRAAGLGRLLLNAVLLGGELLGGRGDILLRADPDGVTILLSSATPALAPDWPPLGVETTGPRRFQHAWTAALAGCAGARLDPRGPKLRILLPA